MPGEWHDCIPVDMDSARCDAFRVRCALVLGCTVMAAAAAACGFDPSGRGGRGGGGDGDGGAPGRDDGGGGGGGGDGASAAGFAKEITVAAVGGADLADFPLYIEIDDADLAARAASDGSDIRFTDAAGQPLDHEVQRWGPESGRLEAWVRVTLLGGADTVLFLRYGEPDPPPPPDRAAVWASDFAAVWHLEESPAGALADSLGVHPGTPSGGMNDASSVDGTLGRAVDLDGGDDTIAFDNPLAGASAHTLSAWVRQEATGNNDALIVLGTGACSEARWLHTRYDQDTVALGFYCDDMPDSGIDLQDAGWKLVHWTYAAGESRLFVDGEQAGATFTHDGAPDTQGPNGFIGNVPTSAGFGSNMGLNGAVDEVRIARRVRPPTWIAAEFANQSAPSAFFALGPEQPL